MIILTIGQIKIAKFLPQKVVPFFFTQKYCVVYLDKLFKNQHLISFFLG